MRTSPDTFASGGTTSSVVREVAWPLPVTTERGHVRGYAGPFASPPGTGPASQGCTSAALTAACTTWPDESGLADSTGAPDGAGATEDDVQPATSATVTTAHAACRTSPRGDRRVVTGPP